MNKSLRAQNGSLRDERNLPDQEGGEMTTEQPTIAEVIGILGKAKDTFQWYPWRIGLPDRSKCISPDECLTLIEKAIWQLEELEKQGVRAGRPSRLDKNVQVVIQETMERVAEIEEKRQGHVIHVRNTLGADVKRGGHGKQGC